MKPKAATKRKPGYEFIVGVPDTHDPYVDPRALGAAIRFLKRTAPQRVVLMGDHFDCYQLSRFDKDPQRVKDLQADADKAHETLKLLRGAAPNATFDYLRGNHEDRVRRYLWSNPAIASLRGITVPALLGLESLGIKYHEEGHMRVGDVIFKHGSIVRSKSGYSGMAELERNWLSGVSGHTHRLAEVYRQNQSGYYKWIEAGCLCELMPEYAAGEQFDWQHGIVWGWIERGGNRFSLHTSPIVNGQIVYGGVEV